MKRRLRNRITSEAELNLIPVMNLFVGLVPFLLLSAAFVPLGGMDVKIPAAAAKEIPADKKKDLSVTFEIKNGTLVIAGYYNDFTQPAPGVSGVFSTNDSVNILAYLAEIKRNHEKIEMSLLHVHEDTKYEEAIKLLNIIRSKDEFKNVLLATEVVE